MEKINIAELLANCPKGMELYSPLCGKCVFDGLNMGTIICKKQNTQEITFTSHGYYMLPVFDMCECMIFPSQDQRDWSKFQRPFKDGDILVGKAKQPFIFKSFNRDNGCFSYCGIDCSQKFCLHSDDWTFANSLRFATEEEKQKLFQAIKDNGYKWNAKTKVLEKLINPKFHKGDWIVFNGLVLYVKEVVNGFYRTISKCGIANSYDWDIDNIARLWTIQDAKDGDVLFHSDSASNGIFIFKEILQRGTLQKVICYCDYDSEDGFSLGENHTCCWADSKILYPATKERRDLLFQKMKEAGYKWNPEAKTLGKLVNKFDISSLKPFQKLLVRDSENQIWKTSMWECYQAGESYPYFTMVGCYKMCIPYESNEHLLGTTDDCDEYYKAWEN